MTGKDSITLLHISDLQFGRHHRFGNLAGGDHEVEFDTLFNRLSECLKGLAKKGIQPEVIVVSGDLAEEGLRKEFDDALKFLNQLSTELGVSRERVVIVPGNHDVNWNLSTTYFNECEGKGKKPKPPYWPKWKCYAQMFNDFFDGGRPAFTKDQPWSFWEIDDLKLVVAGLNSTMAESHRDADHYGKLGERQLIEMAARLSKYQKWGWFRLGVVHHNTSRAPVNDDENLRDADRLANLLAPSLNLLLHGHTHDSKISWLGDRPLPVLSTGSAGLSAEARPVEVPNQFQLIRIHPKKVVRWTLCYAPDGKKWIGDTRSSPDGLSWQVKHQTPFDSVHATFGNDGTRAESQSKGNGNPPPRKTKARKQGAPSAGKPSDRGPRASETSRTARARTPRVVGIRERVLGEVSRSVRDGRSVVISGPEGIGKTRLLEALLAAHSDDKTLNLVPARLEEGRAPRQALQLALHLRFGGNFNPKDDQELSVLKQIVPKGTVLLIDNADSEEAAEAVRWLMGGLPGVAAAVTSEAQDLPDFEPIELDALPEREAQAIVAKYNLNQETTSRVVADAGGNPQRLRQQAAAAKHGDDFDPDAPLASMLARWPKGAMQSLTLIGLLPSSILAEELLLDVGGLGKRGLSLMQDHAAADVILRGEPPSRFVSVHPQLVRLCRERRS